MTDLKCFFNLFKKGYYHVNSKNLVVREVLLSLYSLDLYLQKYGHVVFENHWVAYLIQDSLIIKIL